MPLWAESRIHGDVYVRFGGRLSETYHRKVAWRRQPSLQITTQKLDKITTQKLDNDLTAFGNQLSKSFGDIKVAGV